MPRLTLTSPRLMSPDINSVFQSIKVDLRSEITLVSTLTSFKALIIHVWGTWHRFSQNQPKPYLDLFSSFYHS